MCDEESARAPAVGTDPIDGEPQHTDDALLSIRTAWPRVVVLLVLAACQSGATRGTGCRRSADCASGLVCALDACRQACRESRDCGPDARCLIEPATGVSVCSVAQIDDCTTHGCPAGLTCASGACVNACGDVVACPDGVCMGDVCVTVQRDGGVLDDAGSDAGLDAANPNCHGPGCDPVVQIAMGGGRTLAVTASGALWGWGDTSYGTLGDGVEAHAGCATCAAIPVRALGLDGMPIQDAIAASTGDNFSCAVRRDGSVLCWGRNYAGQLGNGVPDAGDFAPHVVVDASLAPLTGVTLIRSTYVQTCVIRGAAREVWCWGGGSSGQLGTGTTADSNVAVPATELGSGAIDLALAGSHALALLSDGTIRGVGDDGCDELAEVAPSAAALVASPGPVTGASSIATSSYDACAVTGATLSCWGFVSASLGSPTGTFMTCGGCPGACTSTPQAIAQPATHPITHLFGPSGGTFFGTSDDGALYVWGGAFGEPYTSAPMPLAIPLSAPAVEAHVGGSAACLLTSDGDVRCWGKNDHGQLGLGGVSTPDITVGTPSLVVWP